MRWNRLCGWCCLGLVLSLGACEAEPYETLDADADAPDVPGEVDADVPEPDGSDVPDVTEAEDDADVSEDADVPRPDPTLPCGTVACWLNTPTIQVCDELTVPEDFSSGRYNAHRYRKTLRAGWQAQFELEFTAGSEAPAIVVTTVDGRVLSDGAIGSPDDEPAVAVLDDGRSGGPALVTAAAAADVELYVYVTSWSVIDAGFVPLMPTDVRYAFRVQTDCGTLPPGAGIAPRDTMPDEVEAGGTGAVTVGGELGPSYRVDAAAGEHITFRLDFAPPEADVRWEVYRYDGFDAVLHAQNGSADTAEDGLRAVAVLDAGASRTFWIRFRRDGGGTATGTLTVTREPFVDAMVCTEDCARLLLLPQPNSAADGYGVPGHTIYPYQYGRRDILMAIRHAGRETHRVGESRFTVKDLSRWDGLVWADHDTHEAGLHADFSLINTSGDPIWGSLCSPVVGNVCAAGASTTSFGARHMARLIDSLLDSGRVIWILLDRAYHAPLLEAVDDLIAEGAIDAGRRPYFDATTVLCDGRPCLRHVEYHHHHLHIKVAPDP